MRFLIFVGGLFLSTMGGHCAKEQDALPSSNTKPVVVVSQEVYLTLYDQACSSSKERDAARASLSRFTSRLGVDINQCIIHPASTCGLTEGSLLWGSPWSPFSWDSLLSPLAGDPRLSCVIFAYGAWEDLGLGYKKKDEMKIQCFKRTLASIGLGGKVFVANNPQEKWTLKQIEGMIPASFSVEFQKKMNVFVLENHGSANSKDDAAAK